MNTDQRMIVDLDQWYSVVTPNMIYVQGTLYPVSGFERAADDPALVRYADYRAKMLKRRIMRWLEG